MFMSAKFMEIHLNVLFTLLHVPCKFLNSHSLTLAKMLS